MKALDTPVKATPAPMRLPKKTSAKALKAAVSTVAKIGAKFTVAKLDWTFSANVNPVGTVDGWTSARLSAFANLCTLATMSQYGPYVVSLMRSFDSRFNSPLFNESLPRAVSAFSSASADYNPARVESFADAKRVLLREAYAKRVASLADSSERDEKIRNHELVMQNRALKLGKIDATTFANIASAIDDLRTSGCTDCTMTHRDGSITVRLIDALSPIFGNVTNSQFGKIIGKILAQ